MDHPDIPASIVAFLAAPNPAVIATVGPAGQPVSVATWYLLEDDHRLLVNMDAERKRLHHIRGDPRVSLTALGGNDWSAHVSVQGRVVDVSEDTNLKDIDRLSQHYTNQPFPHRNRPRVSARIQISRWHCWGLSEQPGS